MKESITATYTLKITVKEAEALLAALRGNYRPDTMGEVIQEVWDKLTDIVEPDQ